MRIDGHEKQQADGVGEASNHYMQTSSSLSSEKNIQDQIELYERLLLLGSFSDVSEGVRLLLPEFFNHVGKTEQNKGLEVRLLFITIQAFIGCKRSVCISMQIGYMLKMRLNYLRDSSYESVFV
jgi:hypothetical protein